MKRLIKKFKNDFNFNSVIELKNILYEMLNEFDDNTLILVFMKNGTVCIVCIVAFNINHPLLYTNYNKNAVIIRRADAFTNIIMEIVKL